MEAGNFSVAAVRADGGCSSCPTSATSWCWAQELAVARLQSGYSARSGVTETGVEYRIVAVPLDEVSGNYALVLGRPLNSTNDILSSLWPV